MKRLTIFLLGLSILISSGFTLQAMKKSDLFALKMIGVRWNIPFIPDYKLPVIPKYGPQVSLVGTVGAAGVGCKVGCLITEMIKSSPKKADEFLKEHTNIKGALKIGHILLQTITPIPWGFRKINKALEGQSWFENTQNLFAQPATWGVVGGGLLGWYVYSKLYRYTRDGLIKDAEKCVDILKENKLKTKIYEDESNLSAILGDYIQGLSEDGLILDALREWKLVLSIITPLIENYKNTLSKQVQQNLNGFSEAIQHNYLHFTTGKWERFQGRINAEANKKSADAQAKMADAVKTAWGYALFNALFKTGKFFVTNQYGQVMLMAGMGAFGLKKVSDSFNKWSSGVESDLSAN